MTGVSYRSGGAFGLPFMKFTLTYDGPLPSSGNKSKPEDVWRIRKDFHPQLADLWGSHQALRWVEDNRHFPKHGGSPLVQVHHEFPGPVTPLLTADGPDRGVLDLCAPINKHGAHFRPLVRDSYALHCGLKIVFLRRCYL